MSDEKPGMVPINCEGLTALVRRGFENNNPEPAIAIVEQWTTAAALEVAWVREQRDALVVACERALSVMTGPEYGGAPGTTHAISELTAALALAKGGGT